MLCFAFKDGEEGSTLDTDKKVECIFILILMPLFKLTKLIRVRLSPILHHWLDPLNVISSTVAFPFVELCERRNILQCRYLINTVHKIES